MRIQCTICGKEVYNDHNLNTNYTSYTNECEWCMEKRRLEKNEEEKEKEIKQ